MTSSPLFQLDLSELRTTRPGELLVRFGFGAGVSVASGLAAQLIGPLAGGLLLAFPAVLPAAITLIEKREGNAAAAHDVGGALFGAVGLVAFAIVASQLLGRTWPVVALPGALGAWVVVSLTLYVLRATGLLPTAAPLAGERGSRSVRRPVLGRETDCGTAP